LLAGGAVYCWGHNELGQLGDGTRTDRSAPGPLAGELGFVALYQEATTPCGVTADGGAVCWGRNDHGQIGDGSGIHRSEPSVIGAPFGAATPPPVIVTSGEAFTCALSSDGAAYCWGINWGGQLGDTTNADHYAPMAVATTERFVALTAGFYHACALDAGGQAWCWGYNGEGQLTSPVLVSGGHVFIALDAAAESTCGLTATGEAYCWGYNGEGTLGDGTTVMRGAPVAVVGGHHFVALESGLGSHVCGIRDDGDLYCWGANWTGQVGDGTSTNRSTPVSVALGDDDAVGLALGYDSSCVRTSSGSVSCWGENGIGSLGDGTTTSRSLPVPVIGGDAFVAVYHGYYTPCGVTPDNRLWCWGANWSGQLGIGTVDVSAHTRPERLLPPF
jgi:alpha-tubulin suppressor-like RCC1 family protein